MKDQSIGFIDNLWMEKADTNPVQSQTRQSVIFFDGWLYNYDWNYTIMSAKVSRLFLIDFNSTELPPKSRYFGDARYWQRRSTTAFFSGFRFWRNCFFFLVRFIFLWRRILSRNLKFKRLLQFLATALDYDLFSVSTEVSAVLGGLIIW